MAEEAAPVEGTASGGRLLQVAAPALVLLAAVVPFLRFHEYSLVLPESLLLMSGACAIGAGVGLAASLRPATIGAALMAVTLSVYIFLYRPEITDPIVRLADRLAGLTGHGAVVLAAFAAAFFLAVGLLCWLLQQRIYTIVAAVFGTIVLSSLLLPAERGGEPLTVGALPADLRDLPPVIHIVLDEHIGLAGLPSEFDDRSAAAHAIETTYRDFALYTRAYSRFAETQYSLSSLLNGDLGEEASALLEETPARHGLKRNAWFERLKAKGYAISVYQSAWFDLCDGAAAVDRCYTYQLYSPNPIQRAPLPTLAKLRVLTAKLLDDANVPQLSPLGSSEALAQFEADVDRAPRGVAYIVHLLMPHFGYMFRGDCSLADPKEWGTLEPIDVEVLSTPDERAERYRLYLPQLLCTQTRLAALFERLKRLGVYDSATIIVHGDHGSRIAERPFRYLPAEMLSDRDLLDHFSTLLAVKGPNIAPGLRPEPAVLQRVFAETFLGGRSRPAGSGAVLVRTGAGGDFAPRQFVWPEIDRVAAAGSAGGGELRLSTDRAH